MPLGMAHVHGARVLGSGRAKDGRTQAWGREGVSGRPGLQSPLGETLSLHHWTFGGGKGHPRPAERGTQREDSSEQLEPRAPLALRQLTGVRLPCGSPGTGQCLSRTPDTREAQPLTPRWRARTSHPHVLSHTPSHTHARPPTPHTPRHTASHSPIPQTFRPTLSAHTCSHARSQTTHALTHAHACAPTRARSLTRPSHSQTSSQSHSCALRRPSPALLHAHVHTLRACYLAPSSSCTLTHIHVHTQTPSPSRALHGQCLRPQHWPSPGFPVAPIAVTAAGLGGTPARSAGPGSPCCFLRGLQTEGSSPSPG